MQVLLSVTVMLVDLSVAIMQVNVFVTIIQLEVSTVYRITNRGLVGLGCQWVPIIY